MDSRRGNVNAQRSGSVQGYANRAVVWGRLIEKRMDVADRQHHRNQQQQNAAGDGNFANAH